MAEVLVQFSSPVRDENGRKSTSLVRAALRWRMGCGTDGSSSCHRVGETRSDPVARRRSRIGTDTEYWATGLTEVYLEGALQRARNPRQPAPGPVIQPPVFDTAADTDLPSARTESILNPFSVYRKGEALLRNQLGRALSLASREHCARARSERSSARRPECVARTRTHRDHRGWSASADIARITLAVVTICPACRCECSAA